MRTLIANGRIVTAVDSYQADLLIEGETVAVIGNNLARIIGPVDRTIDAAGKIVIPGGVDPHTHLELRLGGTVSSDDFETGTRAAAFGGTTTIIDFATQLRGQDLSEALDFRLKEAEGKASVDYGFHLIITDFSDERRSELRTMVRLGVPSFKLFMAYPGAYLVDDGTIFNVMAACAEEGGLACVHAENGVVIDQLVKRALAQGRAEPRHHAMTRPATAEAEGVHRAIVIAAIADAPAYIVHVSCREALEEVKAARGLGLPVFAETCPQYLFLDKSSYELAASQAARYVMTPPLRDKINHEPLWEGLRNNDLQVVATDHCPFRTAEKESVCNDFSRIPNGVTGIEDRMSLIYTAGVTEGRLSLNRFVDLTSTAAAKIFGLFPRKGTIAVGSDADIVIFDTDRDRTIRTATHHMNVDYNPYEGRVVKGVPEFVLSRGKVIVESDTFLGRPGAGQFLRRAGVGRIPI